MKRINLSLKDHYVKIGAKAQPMEPNVTEDAIFFLNGQAIGFYIRDTSERFQKLATAANREFLSKRVPKSEMRRSSGLTNSEAEVKQYSTILGYVPPKAVMRRPHASISSVHRVKSAHKFISLMRLLSRECEGLIKEHLPETYEEQKAKLAEVDSKWRFTDLYTSSISNFNIPANYHRDTGNITGTVNAIVTKRSHSEGGGLHVPDFGIMVEQADNSLLVYPAWKNVHGVTPIEPQRKGGYRNSLIFYPLKTKS